MACILGQENCLDKLKLAEIQSTDDPAHGSSQQLKIAVEDRPNFKDICMHFGSGELSG